MKTAPDLLARLQVAWQASPATSTTPKFQAVDLPVRCRQHIDPKAWVDQPDPKRSDWLRTACKKCGAFIPDIVQGPPRSAGAILVRRFSGKRTKSGGSDRIVTRPG